MGTWQGRRPNGSIGPAYMCSPNSNLVIMALTPVRADDSVSGSGSAFAIHSPTFTTPKQVTWELTQQPRKKAGRIFDRPIRGYYINGSVPEKIVRGNTTRPFPTLWVPVPGAEK